MTVSKQEEKEVEVGLVQTVKLEKTNSPGSVVSVWEFVSALILNLLRFQCLR